MRTAIAILLLVLAVWRAAIDWSATLGAGYAYRFDTVAGVAGGRWPDALGRFVAALRENGPAWAWDPLGAFILSLPLAPLLAALAAAFWIARARGPARR
jgi:hypothetical protein